jgi:sulfite reductase alpha subunit-like flavoprotein
MFNFLTKKNISIYIFYGSQTGYAESVAKHLFNEIQNKVKPIHNNIDILNNFFNYTIQKDDFVIILLSTTGDGDFPDNAMKFYKVIKKYREPLLTNINYALIGFGDSNYRSYCHSSKYLNRRLHKLKATQFLETHYNDEATGDQVDEWLNKVLEYLKNYKRNILSWFMNSMNNKN